MCRDVRPHDESKKVELRIYYNNKKVKSLFIKNNYNKPVENLSVVYQFNCDKVPCKEAQRVIEATQQQQLKKEQNNILQLKNTRKHIICNITGSQILPNIKMHTKLSGKADLMILEALLIKQQRTMINTEVEDFNRVLKIF